ncbi:MAG: DUF1573 domain-containing protein [Dysgonamonadaceae bacterium]|jgi:hypothetical protein|nr:DUF1573 domain-containing protein [Dysgonamonadaceae bacterium]
MKKTILTLLFGVVLSGALFAQNNTPVPLFKTTIHNFGTVKEGGKISCSFEVANIGKVPLKINDAQASCGCTKPTITENLVLPSKSSIINVTYDTNERPGNFSKTIRVYTNVPDTVYELYIKGSVTPKQR